MQEQWSRWTPLQGLHKKYTVMSISDIVGEGLTIHMSSLADPASYPSEREIQIFFPGSVYAYRLTDEGDRLNLQADLSQRYGGEFYWQWTFFTVKDSLYVQWLLEESCSVAERDSIKHYALLCDDPVVDILSIGEPIVNYVE